MRLRPVNALAGAVCAVAASTLLLPRVTGYGTSLFELVVLGAWSILAHLTSDRYADTHHPALWAIAAVINLVAFFIPETVIWFATRKRWPTICSVVTCVWCGFYLLALFYLFPATDGP
jgi:hypothetical protein